jgi:hypothetical protein
MLQLKKLNELITSLLTKEIQRYTNLTKVRENLKLNIDILNAFLVNKEVINSFNFLS